MIGSEASRLEAKFRRRFIRGRRQRFLTIPICRSDHGWRTPAHALSLLVGRGLNTHARLIHTLVPRIPPGTPRNVGDPGLITRKDWIWNCRQSNPVRARLLFSGISP